MNVKEINVLESWSLLKEEHNSLLIDVRSQEEFIFVGFPCLDILGKKPILLPWRTYPGMEINNNFVDDLRSSLGSNSNFDENSKLLFICRSGFRSLEAASHVLELGFDCYNVKNGFEGDLNKKGQRSGLNGWKFNNLPWKQS